MFVCSIFLPKTEDSEYWESGICIAMGLVFVVATVVFVVGALICIWV